jgi:hypothetical protein
MTLVKMTRMEDSGKFVAEISVSCALCETKFRFLGVPAGISFDRPMVSVDGTELRAPMAPQNEPVLANRYSVEVPEMDQRGGHA